MITAKRHVRTAVKEPPFEIEPRCKFFDANRSIVEYEMRPGNTVTFLSEVDLSDVEMIRARTKAAGLQRPSYTTRRL